MQHIAFTPTCAETDLLSIFQGNTNFQSFPIITLKDQGFLTFALLVQLELYLNTSRYTSITPVLKKLHWLPVEQRTVFKTPTLVYKFLHTGFPRYFAPHLSSYSSSYSTRLSQSGGNFLVIPKFYPSVHKSVKQFGNSFAFDAPTVWNPLPDAIRASPFSASFLKQLKTYLYTKLYPTLAWIIPWCSPWCLTPLLSMDIEIWSTAFFVFLRLRVLLYGEIKCYKSPIRIRMSKHYNCSFLS